MRPMRTIAAALLLAGLALTGAGPARRPQRHPGNQPPATTTAPGGPRGHGPSQPHPDHHSTITQAVCHQAVGHWGSGLWRRPVLGTGPQRVSAAPITAEIYQVRAATHEGCDRVVFDLNGLGRVGWLVRYVPTVHADPSDQPIRVAGGAVLQVTIQAPDFRESGHQPGRTPWQLGQRLVGAQTTLREVRVAGSFEHVSTFAVGVRSRRPFRVLVVPDPGSHVTRVAVDIAH